MFESVESHDEFLRVDLINEGIVYDCLLQPPVLQHETLRDYFF